MAETIEYETIEYDAKAMVLLEEHVDEQSVP
jgi:hypothetical protein